MIKLTHALFGLAVSGAAIFAVAGPASADSGQIVAVTHSDAHPDTTGVSGPACGTSPNGPVWAYDNLSERFTVVPEAGPGNYSLTIDVSGSFAAFADPNTCQPLTDHGSVRGTIQYDISSPGAPDKTALPSQEPDGTGLGAAISQLFGGSYAIAGGGHYSFTYTQVDGTKYVQVG